MTSESKPEKQEITGTIPRGYLPDNAVRGGMGMVIFCVEESSGRPVALKTFKPEYLGNRNARLRFLGEAINWVRLGSHPNIVRAIRVETAGQPPVPFIVVEKIIGNDGEAAKSLGRLILDTHGNGLPVERALSLTLQIVRGMKHAAKQLPRFVHRDLKPGNILINQHGHARVSDFGLSGAFSEEHREHRQKNQEEVDAEDYTPAGTHTHIAPELWNPETNANQQSDIYAVGLMLVEMLSGKATVSTKDSTSPKEQHLALNAEQLIGEQSDSVRGLVKAGTAIDPQKRFQDWESFERALISVYESMELVVPPEESEIDELSDPASTIQSNLAIALSFLNLEAAQHGLIFAEQALNLAHESDLPAQVAACHELISRINLATGDVERAHHHILQADSITTGVSEKQSLDIRLLHAGILTRAGRFDDARSLLETLLETARNQTDPHLESIVLGSLANVYAEQGNLALAVFHYRGQLAISEQSNDVGNTATCLSNMGTAYLSAKKYEKAFELLQQSYNQATSHGDIPLQLKNLIAICNLCIEAGQTDALCHYGEIYRTLCATLGYEEEIQSITNAMRKAGCAN
ncbi:MAG: protein kinase [Pseudomonadota bacterium]